MRAAFPWPNQPEIFSTSFSQQVSQLWAVRPKESRKIISVNLNEHAHEEFKIEGEEPWSMDLCTRGPFHCFIIPLTPSTEWNACPRNEEIIMEME